MPVTADVKPTNWATLLGILALMGTCSLHPCTSPRYGYAYRLSIAPNQAVFSKLITLSLTSTLCFREVKYASNPFVYVYYSVTGHVIGYADSPEFFWILPIYSAQSQSYHVEYGIGETGINSLISFQFYSSNLYTLLCIESSDCMPYWL